MDLGPRLIDGLCQLFPRVRTEGGVKRMVSKAQEQGRIIAKDFGSLVGAANSVKTDAFMVEVVPGNRRRFGSRNETVRRPKIDKIQYSRTHCGGIVR